jgi:succinylglutamate desuccinylase/aspartoacylase family protein
VQRLGKNINGYFGETINIAAVLQDCVQAARVHGWALEHIPAGPQTHLLALTRSVVDPPNPATAIEPAAKGPAPRIYISAGIHGDEPAGPLAMKQLLADNQWPTPASLWLCPCLNPAGFVSGRRENAEGFDLNRQYLHVQAQETRAHIDWLQRQPRFDLCLCLHEDWESHGFYVYELNPENQASLAEAIVTSVAAVCPIDRSELIEGRPAYEGIIRPSVDPRSRPQWPESFFLLTHKTRLSYTLEAPSDFPLAVRVAGLVAGVQAALVGLHRCQKVES